MSAEPPPRELIPPPTAAQEGRREKARLWEQPPALGRPNPLTPLGWLLLLHVLADITVALYRCVNLDAALTDLLATALPRSQLSLLAIWLVLGREPFSWRLCGLIAGSCGMFTLFTRLLFPNRLGLNPDDYWYGAEWQYYLRPSGPGDLIASAPGLVGQVVCILLLWRVVRAVRSSLGTPRTWRGILRGIRFQFRLQDLAVWVVSLCVTLVAIYHTAPYEGWFEQLREDWQIAFPHWSQWAMEYLIRTMPYALAACAVTWAIDSPRPLALRVLVAGAVTVSTLLAYDYLRSLMPPLDESSARFHWPAISFAALILATLITAGSLFLVRAYRVAYASRSRFATPNESHASLSTRSNPVHHATRHDQ